MTTDRVTVTIPVELRHAGQQEAAAAGVSFSAVITDALAAHLRGRVIDRWLRDYETEHGVFSEAELAALAADAGVPYLAPAPGPR